MTCTQQTRTADVAQTFGCDPSMVIEARAVVAHVRCASDNSCMEATEQEFERNPLDTIVVALATDAKQETSTLNPTPFINSPIA